MLKAQKTRVGDMVKELDARGRDNVRDEDTQPSSQLTGSSSFSGLAWQRVPKQPLMTQVDRSWVECFIQNLWSYRQDHNRPSQG